MGIHKHLDYTSGERLLGAVSRRIADDFALNRDPAGQGQVDAAFIHHFAGAGQQTRPTLAIEASRALGLDVGAAVSFGACIEALHNASLVQDDLQDGALERRGRPSIHTLFGTDIALGLATRLVSTAFVSLSSAGRSMAPSADPRNSFALAAEQVHWAIRETIDGQSRDLDPRADRSVKGLLTVARQKSGPLFALALELPLIAAGHTAELERARDAAGHLGLGYQIIDDLKDRQIDRLQPADANIVNALARDCGAEAANREAIDLARTELGHSCKLAERLPDGCGAHLCRLAGDLLNRLKEQSE
jgi:geranylgeranyl diphosphate synthase type II